MVDKSNIQENIEKAILKKEVSDIISKRFVEVVKCSDNSATHAGEGAIVTMAGDEGVYVPKRHLQHKGYSDDGEDLGYIGSIEYPNADISIDYVHGVIRRGDEEFQMGFDDNYRTDDYGNTNHILKGSANGLFKYQWTEGNRNTRRFSMYYSSLLRDGSVVRLMEELDRAGVNLDSRSAKNDAVNPKLQALLVNRVQFERSVMTNDNFRADRSNLVVGEQISDKDVSSREFIKINQSKNTPTNTSVGRLNDSTLNVRDSVTGDSRSINGRNNNWDNTYKVYTLISQGDGTHAMYLGYPQNVKDGAWDNSGNPQNGLSFVQGQRFKTILVDKTNGVRIQVPVNEV